MLTRHGTDFSDPFPLIVEAVKALPVRSRLIDGEAIVTNDKELAVFDPIHQHQHHAAAVLCVFGLIELDGEDRRHIRIEERKRTLARLLGRFQPGIIVDGYFEGNGAIG